MIYDLCKLIVNYMPRNPILPLNFYDFNQYSSFNNNRAIKIMISLYSKISIMVKLFLAKQFILSIPEIVAPYFSYAKEIVLIASSSIGTGLGPMRRSRSDLSNTSFSRRVVANKVSSSLFSVSNS